MDSAEKIWEWLQGPVVQLAYADENNTCVRDKRNRGKAKEFVNKRSGHIAFTPSSKCRS